MSHRIPVSLLVIALLSGCSTVRITVPPSEYRKLSWPHTYEVVTKDGEIREASWIETPDTALVIMRPRFAMKDPRSYPVSIHYDQIDSITTTRRVSLVYLEMGFVTGKNFGVESPDYSKNRATFDVGYMGGDHNPYNRPRWDGGVTLYLAASERDTRVGLKGHANYRLNRSIQFDLAAGPLFNWWDGNTFNGFVGGVGVDLSPWFSLKSEYTTWKVEPWQDGDLVEHSGGYEQVWYNGAAIRGGPAWFTAGLGAGALTVLIILFMISPPEFPTS